MYRVWYKIAYISFTEYFVCKLYGKCFNVKCVWTEKWNSTNYDWFFFFFFFMHVCVLHFFMHTISLYLGWFEVNLLLLFRVVDWMQTSTDCDAIYICIWWKLFKSLLTFEPQGLWRWCGCKMHRANIVWEKKTTYNS